MNKKQYNNVIENTLKHDRQTIHSALQEPYLIIWVLPYRRVI